MVEVALARWKQDTLAQEQDQHLVLGTVEMELETQEKDVMMVIKQVVMGETLVVRLNQDIHAQSDLQIHEL